MKITTRIGSALVGSSPSARPSRSPRLSVDDMVVLGHSPDQLQHISDAIRTQLGADGLTIHPRNIRVAPAGAGIPFLGYVAWPGHISAGQYVRHRYHQRLRQHDRGHDRTQALRSYRAMMAHTGSTRD